MASWVRNGPVRSFSFGATDAKKEGTADSEVCARAHGQPTPGLPPQSKKKKGKKQEPNGAVMPAERKKKKKREKRRRPMCFGFFPTYLAHFFLLLSDG
ncbi:MAG TPA: hypothetical protein VIO38_03150 [Rariglobus sp.]